jgi:hypothetical protein
MPGQEHGAPWLGTAAQHRRRSKRLRVSCQGQLALNNAIVTAAAASPDSCACAALGSLCRDYSSIASAASAGQRAPTEDRTVSEVRLPVMRWTAGAVSWFSS